MTLTQAHVLEFLLERGGKVRNSELLNNFNEFINCSDPAEKRSNRDIFKSYVNNVAVVKQTDDVKYVVLRRKFQAGVRSDGKAPKTESTVSNSGFVLSVSEQRNIAEFSKRESENNTAPNADVLNNNSCFCTSPITGCFVPGCESSFAKPKLSSTRSDEGSVILGTTSSSPKESFQDAGLLSVTNIARVGKTGAVFAVVAIKSPSPMHLQSANPQSKKGKLNCNPSTKSESQQLLPSLKVLPQEVLVERPVAVRSASLCLSYARDKQRLYGSPRGRRRLSVASCFPASAQDTRVAKQGLDAAVVPLEPREHEWHVKAAMGRWGQVYSLLLQDFQLAEKRSFISGFTALHWAAKNGNRTILSKLLDFSRQAGAALDVNSRSYDGYTPLHVATIHGRETVLGMLVCDYGADCNVRDNSGKKAYHYLPQHVAPEVRRMLGDPHVFRQVAQYKRADSNQHFSDLPKGFNTFSKLFQPSVAQQKKSKRRLSFQFVSNGQDENRKDI